MLKELCSFMLLLAEGHVINNNKKMGPANILAEYKHNVKN